MNFAELGWDFILASGGACVGYVLNGFLTGDLKARIGSLKDDLNAAHDAIGTFRMEIADADESIDEKNELIRTLDAEAEKYADIILKWVPARDARGHFVKKVR